MIAISVAAAVGAWLRWRVTRLVRAYQRGQWPLATFIINISGSFCLGLSLASPWAWLTTGLLGGFTTFSTFATEIVALFDDGHFWQAVSVMILSVSFGFVAVALGWWATPFK